MRGFYETREEEKRMPIHHETESNRLCSTERWPWRASPSCRSSFSISGSFIKATRSRLHSVNEFSFFSSAIKLDLLDFFLARQQNSSLAVLALSLWTIFEFAAAVGVVLGVATTHSKYLIPYIIMLVRIALKSLGGQGNNAGDTVYF